MKNYELDLNCPGGDAGAMPARHEGYAGAGADVARLSPYLYAYINVHGHYTFQPPNRGGRRALRDPDASDDE
jgi:hypothetical protein